jgi:hypothetical protein
MHCCQRRQQRVWTAAQYHVQQQLQQAAAYVQSQPEQPLHTSLLDTVRQRTPQQMPACQLRALWCLAVRQQHHMRLLQLLSQQRAFGQCNYSFTMGQTRMRQIQMA